MSNHFPAYKRYASIIGPPVDHARCVRVVRAYRAAFLDLWYTYTWKKNISVSTKLCENTFFHLWYTKNGCRNKSYAVRGAGTRKLKGKEPDIGIVAREGCRHYICTHMSRRTIVHILIVRVMTNSPHIYIQGGGRINLLHVCLQSHVISYIYTYIKRNYIL